MARTSGSCGPTPPPAGVTAELLSEIERLRRERDELRELVREQEADLSPRTRDQGLGAGGRARSSETRWDLERLVAAQEATTAAAVGLAAPSRNPRSGGREAQSICCSGVHSRQEACTPVHSMRRSPSAGCVPSVSIVGLPRGSGVRGFGHPEGCGGAARRPQSAQVRPPTPPWRPPRPSQAAKTSAPCDLTSSISPLRALSPRDGSLEDKLSEALRGLGGARGALAEASKQLSREAHRRSSEAWRLHRLEQVMAASLGGFGRELRALRADSAQARKEACHRMRCSSRTRCRCKSCE